jgi:XTP/dITP diphosphohydrolase
MMHSLAATRRTTTSTRARLVLATNNQGKIEELRHILGTIADIVGMAEFGAVAAEETGHTFEENATLKAEAVARQTGLPALADDSGLEVDALGGAPGVYSARFAGPEADDAANRSLLLQGMQPYQTGYRGARFVCSIAFARPGQDTITVRGTCEGNVGLQEIGTNGFGYDSLFVLPDGRTMAQLDADEKNRISHRAKAMKLILPVLERELNAGES